MWCVTLYGYVSIYIEYILQVRQIQSSNPELQMKSIRCCREFLTQPQQQQQCIKAGIVDVLKDALVRLHISKSSASDHHPPFFLLGTEVEHEHEFDMTQKKIMEKLILTYAPVFVVRFLSLPSYDATYNHSQARTTTCAVKPPPLSR